MPDIRTGIYPHMPITVTCLFVTLTFNLSRSSKVKSMGPRQEGDLFGWESNLAIPDIFHVKNMTLIFDP